MVHGIGRVLGTPTLVLALAAAPATAQTRLFAIFAIPGCSPTLGCVTGTVFDIDVERGRVNGTAPVTPGTDVPAPAVTPDGRYLVFAGYRSPGAHLDALDTSSYTLSSFYVTASAPGFGFAVHPTTAKAYFQRPSDGQLFVIDAVSGLLPLTAPTDVLSLLRHISGDGSRLFTFRFATNDVLVTDSVTGASLGVVGNAYDVLAVNADGTEIYAYGLPNGWPSVSSAGTSQPEQSSPPRACRSAAS